MHNFQKWSNKVLLDFMAVRVKKDTLGKMYLKMSHLEADFKLKSRLLKVDAIPSIKKCLVVLMRNLKFQSYRTTSIKT